MDKLAAERRWSRGAVHGKWCEGCAEETREERERGAKVSGERRESEEGGRAVRRVRLSEP